MDQKQQIDVIQQRGLEIANRRAQIGKEINDLNVENLALAKEQEELAVAARVMARLLQQPERAILDQEAPQPPRQGKPPGIPTVYDMADRILQEAEVTDGEWIEGQEIVARIRSKWWPDARTVDIVPTLWRLAQQDRLRKEGTKYARIQQQGLRLRAAR
jgi:hypothetical protein